MCHMWLGIDVGTGGSRALLVDERGGVRAGYTALHEDMQMARPHVGGAAARELVGRGGGRHPRRAGAGRRDAARTSRASDSPARCTGW